MMMNIQEHDSEEASPNPAHVAGYINSQIKACGKSQIDIARETGFDKPNMITMIKQGSTKLPLDKIGRFAKAIEVDPIYLFQLCMSEYHPETWSEILRIIGQPILTLNELEILDSIRASKVLDPKIRTLEDKRRLLDVLDSF
jgi:transcriptional regulator with XRE-family HTH domain